jgi:hypothetical protein
MASFFLYLYNSQTVDSQPAATISSSRRPIYIYIYGRRCDKNQNDVAPISTQISRFNSPLSRQQILLNSGRFLSSTISTFFPLAAIFPKNEWFYTSSCTVFPRNSPSTCVIDSLLHPKDLRRRVRRRRLIPVQPEHYSRREWDHNQLSILRNVRGSSRFSRHSQVLKILLQSRESQRDPIDLCDAMPASRRRIRLRLHRCQETGGRHVSHLQPYGEKRSEWCVCVCFPGHR